MNRLPNGLTPTQDAALTRLAEAIASLSPQQLAEWAASARGGAA